MEAPFVNRTMSVIEGAFAAEGQIQSMWLSLSARATILVVLVKAKYRLQESPTELSAPQLFMAAYGLLRLALESQRGSLHVP